MADKMVEDATSALEVIVDKSWMLWAARLIPNVACQVRETEEKAHEEAKHKDQDEAGEGDESHVEGEVGG